MNIGENRLACVQRLSSAVRDIVEPFEFHIQIDRLH